ncbi:hypothetical protein C8_152 [Cannes 8 virus]|nr:hypothetical protein C8_152 [Cannes 8 virus]
MQSLIVEALRYNLHISQSKNSEKLQKCLELMQVLDAKKPLEEQRYALCRYNEVLYDDENREKNISAHFKKTLGYVPSWYYANDMGRHEFEIYDDEVIVDELSGTNAIWWESGDSSYITFLPPRPLEEGDLDVKLVCKEGAYTIIDSDGDETPCERDDAIHELSSACERRKAGYPLLSYSVETVESML